MRIQKLNNLTPISTNYTLQNKRKTVDSNSIGSSKPLELRDLTYNRLQVNFRGEIEKAALALVKQFPLEEKLADAFSFLKHGDLLITGSNLKSAQTAMLNSIPRVKDVIKRAFFIEDDKAPGILGFMKNSLNEVEVINGNPDRLFLTTDGKEYYLDAYDSYFVIPGDKLKYKDKELGILDKPKSRSLAFHRYMYAQAFNFEKEAEKVIQGQNKKTLKELYHDRKPIQQVMFKDVAGADNVIKELKEGILYPLRNPKAYENIDLTHGYILHGPPGTGKTYVAKALQNEAGINAKYLNGLELESKWVGDSEKGWRDLFDEAIENQPYLIFLDEFDAVARARGGQDVYGDKVVNQILTLMTDIEDNKHDVFVLAATNNKDAIDPAILRSGRFGKHLEFKKPDREGVGKIFDIHARKKPLDENLNKEEIIQAMFNAEVTGADIKRIVNDAYLNGYSRAGILQKLDENALTEADLSLFRITKEDLMKAIDNFKASRASGKRKPIGYNRQ